MSTEGDIILQFERQQNDRLIRLEERIDSIEKEIDEHSKAVLLSLNEIIFFQKQHESTLDTLNKIVNGSMLLKWIVTAVLGAAAAIGVFHSAIEIIMKWWQK